MVKNIIFDFDGTIADTSGDVIDCLKKAYFDIIEKKNVIINKKHIGPPLDQMIKIITPDIDTKLIPEIITSFRKYYDDEKYNYPKTIFFKNVKPMLINFKKDKIDLFIATNKPIIPITKILKKIGAGIFSDVAALDIFKDKTLTKKEMIKYIIEKWELENDETLMIGDTSSDIEAAKVNNLKSAAVKNGYGDMNY